MRHRRFSPRETGNSFEVPFESAEEAWFWFIAATLARAAGARPIRDMADPVRPCLPDDIHRIVEQLYRDRLLHRRHLAVLSEYGQQFLPPTDRTQEQLVASRLWDEAMSQIEAVMRGKGLLQ